MALVPRQLTGQHGDGNLYINMSDQAVQSALSSSFYMTSKNILKSQICIFEKYII